MSSIHALTAFAHFTDLDCLELKLGESRVVVSLYGAHVLCYEVAGQPVLWLSPTADWRQKKAIRGGIPICWPWFGACPEPFQAKLTDKPNHGFARTEVWQLKNQQANAEAVSVLLSLSTDPIAPELKLGEVFYQIELTAEGLTVHLYGKQVAIQQAALHSYFSVADCTLTKVGNLPAQFYDKTVDMECTDHSTVCHFHAEVDRIYHAPAKTVQLIQPHQTLDIAQQGQDSTVVWNPGEEKTRQSNDIPAAQWNKFVCVESADLSLKAKQLALTQQIRNPFQSLKQL